MPENPQKSVGRAITKPRHIFKIGLSIILITTVIWIAACFATIYIFKHFIEKTTSTIITKEEWELYATISDSLGALNCLVSGLAFAGVIASVIMQSRELKLQRLSLQDSHNEMKASVKAQNESAEALRIQIEMLKLTAQINGLGALLRSYDTETNILMEEIKGAELRGDHRKRETLLETHQTVNSQRNECKSLLFSLLKQYNT